MKIDSASSRNVAGSGTEILRCIRILGDAKYTNLVILILSLLVAFLLIGREIWLARWGIIDDHEIFDYLGQRQVLPIDDIFHTIMTKTEVGVPYARYRPVYYTFRVIETALWGRSVQFWYVTVVALFAATIAGFWRCFSYFMPIWLAGLWVIPIISLPFWSGIWTRLGPAEIYGAPALALMMSGTAAVMAAAPASNRIGSAVTLALSAIVLLGSKETFFPLVLAPLACLAYGTFTKKIQPIAGALALVITTAFAAYMYHRIKNIVAVADPSAQSLPEAAKVACIEEIWGLGRYYLGVITCSAAVRLIYIRTLRGWWLPTVAVVLVIGFASGILASQYLAYQGNFTGTRYDFPARLYAPVGYALLACYAFQQAASLFAGRLRSLASLALSAIFLVVVAPMTTAELRGSPLEGAVDTNIRVTSAFFQAFGDVVTAAQAKPGNPVILEAFDVEAYEPTFSLQRYLSAYGINNPLVLQYTDPAPKGLALVLIDLMNGKGGFTAFAPEMLSGNCISVGLSKPSADSHCQNFEETWY